MYARIHDKENDRYYKSAVYGIFYMKGGMERYIVLDPLTNSFLFAERDDIRLEYADSIVIITPDTDGFNTFRGSWFRKYSDVMERDEHIRFFGCDEVWRDERFMRKLFTEGRARAEDAGFPIIDLPDRDKWEYIENQEQAEELVKLLGCFHDASLDKLTYECDYNLRRVTAVFDSSEWCDGRDGKAELCFEGVEDFHIYPPDHRRWSQYWSGSVCVTDKYVLWAEGSGRNLDNYDKEFDYILAMSLKWRRLTDMGEE